MCILLSNPVTSSHDLGEDPPMNSVYRIVIQRNFQQHMALPNPEVWRNVPNILQSRLLVCVRRKQPFFFYRHSKHITAQCTLTVKGYLIVYAKEAKLKGYAVKLQQAQSIEFTAISKTKVNNRVCQSKQLCLNNSKI